MSITRPIAVRITQPIPRALNAPGVGGGWSPSNLFAGGEQGAWFDPSDFSTMFQDTAGAVPVTAVGQSVARINDKSGRGNHATQATAANRPILQQDAGGNYYLSFDGTNDLLSTASINFTATDKIEAYLGVRVVGTGNQGVLCGASAGSGRFDCLYLAGAAPTLRGTLFGSGGPAQVTTAGVTANTQNAVHSFLFNIAGAAASDEIKVRVNGSLPAQTVATPGPAGTGNFSSQPINLGAIPGAFFFNGRIYQCIVRAALSSATDRDMTETWCASFFS